LKPERWGSPLVQEKYREEKACDKLYSYRIIIIWGMYIHQKKRQEKIQHVSVSDNTDITEEEMRFS